MTIWLPTNPPSQYVARVSRPFSYDYLPPVQVPSRRAINYAQDLLRELVEESGLQPGVHSSLDDGLYEPVKFVYDRLLDVVKQEIATLDVLDLTFKLYEWVERLVGHLEARRYEDIPHLMTVGYPPGQNEVHALWKHVSPYTEGVRWLIEVAIASSSSSDAKVSEPQFYRLVALTRELVQWDAAWEHIAHGILPHDAIIQEDFSLRFVAHPRSIAAQRAYEDALRLWRREDDRQFLGRSLASGGDAPDIESIVDYPRLNEAMTEEFGYNLRDRLNFCLGLFAFLDDHEYIKMVPKGQLLRFMNEQRQLNPQTIESLLLDHSLFRHLDGPAPPEPAPPVEEARRDSRLLRRPIVVMEQPDKEAICIYGAETLAVSSLRFRTQFLGGLVQFPRMTNKSKVKREIGRIQKTLGNPFRDEIAARCQAIGIEAHTEISKVGEDRISAGTGFGPVDVLVADTISRRFVLVEAKDTQSPDTVPKKLKGDRKRFVGYVSKLESQVQWFMSRVDALKAEFGLDASEEYRVEGVIVVNGPRLWLYASQERLPILTDVDFYNLLADGGSLVSPVVDVDSNLPGKVLYLPDGRRLRT